MAKKADLWQTISISPMSGVLDTRSRPAEVPLGGYRYKLNWSLTPDAKLCRRDGFGGFDLGLAQRTNADLRTQGGAREALTMGFESTTGDGQRRLFVGSQSNLWLLNGSAGTWSKLTPTPLGASGTRWRAAELQDTILFVNNQNLVLYWQPGFGQAQIHTGISGAGVAISTAAVVASYNGFLFLMNVVRSGQRKSSEVYWCDINNPAMWQLDNGSGPPDPTAGSLAGYQDLDYGDDILAAAPLLGALYIFTRRAIWRMMPSSDTTAVFSFTKVYSEPKNQSGCLAYPNTLVSDGENLWYMGRDGIYRYNPYIPVPVRDDWLYRASGLIYRKLDSQLDDTYCLSPVAEYVPTTREIWFSWPDAALGTNGNNNWTLVAQIEQHTADVVDHGFTMMVNFRFTAESIQKCNETQYFLVASGTDWTIKSIGGVFAREMYQITLDPATGLPDRTVDLTADDALFSYGYYSILRGMVPLGMNDREKKLRKVLVDHDTSDADAYPVVRLRIGNAPNLVDPNDADDHCAPLWRVINYDIINGVVNPPLACPDGETLTDMSPFAGSSTGAMTLTQAKTGLASRRANKSMCWGMMEAGKFLFFEFTVQNSDGSPAIGGDSCLQRIDFDALAMPKA